MTRFVHWGTEEMAKRRAGRGIVTAAVAAALFVVPFLIAQPGSAAITQPVNATASVAGGSAAVGVAATVDFTVTNKATNGAKLDLFTIVVPKGVTGVTRVAPPAGWSETLLPCGLTPRCGTLVLVSATRASAFLVPGSSVKFSVGMTPTAPGTLSFPLLGIGNGLFTAISTPTITVGGGPAGLLITSITENGSVLKTLHAGTSFQVAYKIVDAQGNLVASPDLNVSLSALGLGPLASLTTQPVLSHNGVGVITATYLGPNVVGLKLQLSSGSLLSPTAAVDLVGGAVKVTLTPGLNVTITVGDITLSTGTATAILQHGAYGDVTVSVGDCAEPTGCDNVISEVSVLGDFGGTTNEPALYSFDDPAEMDWGCNPDTCRPPGFESGKTLLTDLQAAEYTNHPVMVASSAPNGDGQFVKAPECSGDTTPLVKGRIVEPKAKELGFCIDSGAISRSDENCDTVCTTWGGNLKMPVLFVNDPRFMFG